MSKGFGWDRRRGREFRLARENQEGEGQERKVQERRLRARVSRARVKSEAEGFFGGLGQALPAGEKAAVLLLAA